MILNLLPQNTQSHAPHGAAKEVTGFENSQFSNLVADEAAPAPSAGTASR